MKDICNTGGLEDKGVLLNLMIQRKIHKNFEETSNIFVLKLLLVFSTCCWISTELRLCFLSRKRIISVFCSNNLQNSYIYLHLKIYLTQFNKSSLHLMITLKNVKMNVTRIKTGFCCCQKQIIQNQWTKCFLSLNHQLLPRDRSTSLYENLMFQVSQPVAL